jgi:hypothetical protein
VVGQLQIQVWPDVVKLVVELPADQRAVDGLACTAA